MIPMQIILIAIGALLADASECNCQCDRTDVCDEQNLMRTEQNELRTKVEVHTTEITKWNRHYNFVRRLAKDWQSQVAHVVRQQFEVGMNETLVQFGSQREVFVQKDDLLARMGILENSVRELLERATELDLTMELITDEINGIRSELHRNQPTCNPACENGGQCMQNNICNCTSFYYGERCQDLCGVDFDNGGSNSGRNSSNHVWPWMAAVYKNFNNGPAYVCDGSVINQNFVLTAAGCVDYYGGDGLTVKLGLSNLNSDLKKVRAYHRHPKFGKYSNYDYNVGLLELEEPIQFGPSVRPICLPPRVIPQNDMLYKPQSEAKAVSIGSYIGSPETESPTVVSLTILSEEECRINMKAVDWEKYYPSPGLSFCAESSSSTCPSDGSPLMQYHSSGDGTRAWTHVGVRTWNINCKIFFSTRLDHLRPWVESTVQAASKR